jgi:hypothetical protein
MGVGPRNSAVDAVVEFLTVLESHERSLTEWDRWFTHDFVREDRRQLIRMPTADAATFLQQHLAWFETGDEDMSFEMTGVVAAFGDRLALTRTRIAYSSGFPVDMLSLSQWTEETDRLQKLVQFDSDDMAEALRELDRLRAALEADGVTP